MGLIRRPGMDAIAGGNRRPCTVVSFSRGGPGGAVADLGGGVVPCWTWEEPAGLAQKGRKSQRTPRIRGVLEETARSEEHQTMGQRFAFNCSARGQVD